MVTVAGVDPTQFWNHPSPHAAALQQQQQQQSEDDSKALQQQQQETERLHADLASPAAAAAAASSPASASSLVGQAQEAGTCDASWCNCEACEQSPKTSTCNLCARKWVFVISTGRAGSTSILEGLNALPGVSLGGENFAMLNVAKDMVSRTDELTDIQVKNMASAYEVKSTDLSHQTLCSMQQVFAKLANGSLADESGHQILGFKELVSIPSLSKWTSHSGKPVPHFSAWNSDWLDFIDRLFPCSRIVFNLRRDSAAQGRAIAGTFRRARDLPLHTIEKELTAANENLKKWHVERGNGTVGKSRSFMMYTEDLGPERFTQLAQWLGLNCQFHATPHANDKDAYLRADRELEGSTTNLRSQLRPYFHRDYENINLTCSNDRMPFGHVAMTTAEDPPDARPPQQKLTHGYEEELDRDVESPECAALPPLPQHPTCSPAAEQMTSLLGSEDSAWDRSNFNVSELPTFYLHEEGVFDFSDVQTCYMHAVGGSPKVDDVDKYVFPDVAEHLADMWYLEQFRTHPNRVYNPNDARVHVLGAPLVMAFRAHRGEQWNPDWKSPKRGGNLGGPYGCGTMTQLTERLSRVAKHLKNSFFFQRNNGRDWLLINSYYWIKDILGDDLLELAVRGPMMFTSSDRDFKHYRELRASNQIEPEVIPYKTHYSLDDSVWIDSKYPFVGTRQNQIMFHGSTGRGSFTNAERRNYSEGALRGMMCDTFKDAFGDNSSIKCVRHYMMAHAASLLQIDQGLDQGLAQLAAQADDAADEVYETDFATDARTPTAGLPEVPAAAMAAAPAGGVEFKKASEASKTGSQKVSARGWLVTSGRHASPQSMQQYRESKLCPVPAGDTPTSRRLFDAMAGGCIPILFTPFADIAPNLPFPKSLNWKKLALFGGGLTCSIVEHSKETVAWLKALLEPARAEKLNCLSKRVRTAYRKHLSLRGQGAVSALLLELQRNKKYPWLRPNSQPLVLRPQLDKQCHAEERCGCSGQDTVVVRYHITGQRETSGLLGELASMCSMPDVKYVDATDRVIGPSATKGCRNLKLTLDDDNLPRWPVERLRNLSQARPNTKFVHVVQEPLTMVAEYYAYHISQQDRKAGSVYPALWANITQMTVADGMMHMAEQVMSQHLPTMAKLRKLFAQENCEHGGQQQASGIPCPMRADVTELRMEDLRKDYPLHVESFARTTGVAGSCLVKGSVLRGALDEHRPAPTAVSPGNNARMPEGIGSLAEADGSYAAQRRATEIALKALHQEGTTRSTDVVRRLQAYGFALGYGPY